LSGLRYFGAALAQSSACPPRKSGDRDFARICWG
jgi:hypothetical protein